MDFCRAAIFAAEKMAAKMAALQSPGGRLAKKQVQSDASLDMQPFGCVPFQPWIKSLKRWPIPPGGRSLTSSTGVMAKPYANSASTSP